MDINIDKIDSLKNENELLKNENELLKKENELLKKENELLKKENDIKSEEKMPLCVFLSGINFITSKVRSGCYDNICDISYFRDENRNYTYILYYTDPELKYDSNKISLDFEKVLNMKNVNFCFEQYVKKYIKNA